MLRAAWFASVFLLAALPTQARDTLTIGLNDRGAYPYVTGDGAAIAEPPGLAIDIMRAVGERLQIDLRFVRMPGLRVLSELQDGDLDAALLYSHSGEREAFGAYPMRDGRPDPSRRLATLSYVLYRPAGSRLEWTGERFLNLDGRIAANLNYSIVGDLRKLGASVVEVRSAADSFRMLRAGRVAGVADHAVVADAYLAAAGLSGIEKIPLPLREKAYYLVLSRQDVAADAGRAAAVWGAIGELRDRTTDRLLPRYLGPP